MNRKYLKFQIFISIAIAVLLIIGSAAYMFSELSSYLIRNDLIIKNAQEQLKIAKDLNNHLYQLTQNQISMVRKPSNEVKQAIINRTIDIKSALIHLQEIGRAGENEYLSRSFIAYAEELINDLKQKEIISNEHLDPVDYWLLQQEKSIVTYNNFTTSVFDFRAQEFAKNKAHLDKVRNITIGTILIALLVILFTVWKIYQSLNTLRKSSRELQEINDQFVKAQHLIEENNWILESNTALLDGISGIDDPNEIVKIIIDYADKLVPVEAIAAYIRDDDSDYFRLIAESGINPSEKISKFKLGEDTLGKVALEHKRIVKKLEKGHQLYGKTNLINDSKGIYVFVNPLVFEGNCVGVIEIALNCGEHEIEKFKTFFNRADRNIATRIKFGQNHRIVKNLLEESQVHQEELEAQQEELRITNEELVHKTNLLESSEEELRVQQEELTQTNLELNKKAEELETKNQDLHDAQKIVEQKIREVELASKYKSEFMANMSHELRTPLNSILILAKLLHDNKHQNLHEEQVKYAKVIHDAGADLLQLINELLDLAKIEAGHIDVNTTEINVQEFVKDINELFKAIAVDKNIKFTTQIGTNVPEHFMSDEYRLQQVIKNFLSNAFKFTNPEGSVDFNIQVQSNNLYFEVSDTGKGISIEKQNLIFEAFRQEDGSTSRKYGGTGLGLSISKEIASLLGGRITLESEVDKGSKFTLIIPLQQGIATVKNDASADIIKEKPAKQAIELLQKNDVKTTTSADNRTILIIEDDINFADILKGFAEDYGFSVLLAHDGAKGIELAKSELPNAIILDVMLPIADGWEVLKTLKNDDSTKLIPIHMMSAASFSKKDFLEKGAIGFMHKPVTEDTIQQTFENINLNLSKSVKKILLVEDQELQSDFIKNSFSDQNIHVLQTFSLSSAWNKLQEEENIDCIILDLSLPDGNGLELIEKIKENDNLAQIPIIINTAYELPKEQYDKILSDARATILKSDKSSDRLIDEVNLFLNKLHKDVKTKAPVPTISQTNNLNGKRVLIADDDMRNVFALSTSLQSFDMKIEIANNGIEAIDILKNPNHNVDIVLMDIMMPEMDGYEAIKIIREELKYKNLPILAVTAKAMKGDREKSIQIGANDYVSKPIDIDKLTSLMQVWLG